MRQIIVFALAAGLAVMPASADSESATPTAAADPDQKIKCRKIEVTGSLVKKGKVCKTVAEWRAIAENNNYLARKMVEDGTSKSSSN